jgi:hypothetical protein
MKAFAIAIGVLLPLTSSLAGQSVTITARLKPVLGAGATPCRQWIANVKPGLSGGQQDPVSVSWILGYVSAAGVTGRFAGRDAESYILGFVTASCEKNPTQSIGTATAALVESLQPHAASGDSFDVTPATATPIPRMDYR